MTSLERKIRFTLVSKGLVRPHYPKVDQQPGRVVAVRRADDRPSTQVVPTFYKGKVSYV